MGFLFAIERSGAPDSLPAHAAPPPVGHGVTLGEAHGACTRWSRAVCRAPRQELGAQRPRGVASAPMQGTRTLTHAGSALHQGGRSGPAQSRSGSDDKRQGTSLRGVPCPCPSVGSCCRHAALSSVTATRAPCSSRLSPPATSPRAAAGPTFPRCGPAGSPVTGGLQDPEPGGRQNPSAWGPAGGLRTRKLRGLDRDTSSKRFCPRTAAGREEEARPGGNTQDRKGGGCCVRLPG